MATISNFPVEGSIKQGGLIGKIDFGTLQDASTLVWNLLLVFKNNKFWLFYEPVVNGTAGTKQRLTRKIADDLIGATPTIFGKALPLVNISAQNDILYTTNGIVFETSTTDIYYTDGNGNFKDTAYETTSSSSSLADYIKSIDAVATGNTTTDPAAKKWYQKPLTWILTAVGTIATITYIWKRTH